MKNATSSTSSQPPLQAPYVVHHLTAKDAPVLAKPIETHRLTVSRRSALIQGMEWSGSKSDDGQTRVQCFSLNDRNFELKIRAVNADDLFITVVVDAAQCGRSGESPQEVAQRAMETLGLHEIALPA